MKTPQNPSALSTPALVRELDDATLRSGHALLDANRAENFADWLDSRLNQLESMFDAYVTPQSVRRAIGR